MNCASCGVSNPQGKRFCSDCGEPLPVACPACGGANAPKQKFCGDCGQALVDVASRGERFADAAPPTGAVQQDAERRQLTVMFCDLVGSTQLANRLDPEETRTLLRDFHSMVASAVARYDGHVAQFLGDGVLVYFGYPRAHEDDAGRAVRAALAVLASLAAPPSVGASAAPAAARVPTAVPAATRVPAATPPAPLVQARIGIATGLVVVGDIGQGTPAAERSASGETPNLAARLQALAGPGEIVLSQATRQLLDSSFELAALGPVTLKGFDAPVQAWRAVGERAIASRFEARQDHEPRNLVGRESEVALLLDRWASACEGEAQVVLLCGEAGIGKSRIGQALRERLAGEVCSNVVLQCSPYFSGSALYPVMQHLRRAADFAVGDTPAQQRDKLAALAAPQPRESLAALLRLMGLPGLPDDAAASEAAQMPQQEKARSLNALVELVGDLARQQPVLLWLEDAHWIDPTTEELFVMLVDRLRDARLLTLVTCRPDSVPSLGKPAHLTTLTLNRLGQRQSAVLIEAVALGERLPQEVQAEIVRKTDGVPLFIEELTKTVLQSGLLERTQTGYRLSGPLPELAIPSTLQDSLMARLDRLAEAKEVAQAGAAIGREFTYRLLSAVLQPTAAAQLDKSLSDLERADLLIRRGEGPSATFSFKHALVRDTAYHSLLKTQRRLRHEQIAAALEQAEPDASAVRPELLAHHHQEAGAAQRASELWANAGRLGVARGANREAATAFEKALEQLSGLPQSAQTRLEALDIRIALGPLLFGVYGDSPEVEASYQQALALAESLGDRRRLYQAHWGLNYTRFMAGRYAEALGPAQRLFELASRDDDGGEQLEAHHAMWGIYCWGGKPLQALSHYERGRALYEPHRHAHLRYRYAGHDPGACVSASRSMTYWMLGFPEQAERELQSLRAALDELQHPMTNIMLGIAGWVNFRLGKFDTAARLGTEFIESARKHGFQAMAEAAVVLTELARHEPATPARLSELNEILTRAKSSKSTKTMMSSVLMELCATSGDVALAERVLQPLLEMRDTSHRAEFLRLQGALLRLRATPDSDGAERCFNDAIAVAREQGAKSFELRAAMSLGTLWWEQGKREAARELLGGVYAWFTEGFNTPDLQRAKSLVDEWAIA